MKGRIHSLHAEDINLEFKIKKGKPNKIICEEAVNLDADLIVLGKSSKGKIQNFIGKYGSLYC